MLPRPFLAGFLLFFPSCCCCGCRKAFDEQVAYQQELCPRYDSWDDGQRIETQTSVAHSAGLSQHGQQIKEEGTRTRRFPAVVLRFWLLVLLPNLCTCKAVQTVQYEVLLLTRCLCVFAPVAASLSPCQSTSFIKSPSPKRTLSPFSFVDAQSAPSLLVRSRCQCVLSCSSHLPHFARPPAQKRPERGSSNPATHHPPGPG